MLGIGTSRTLAAVLVSEITVRWSTILPSELRTGNSVTAESIEMMPLSKSTFFHLSASASPMRNPANICTMHSAFMKSFFEMTSRKGACISLPKPRLSPLRSTMNRNPKSKIPQPSE